MTVSRAARRERVAALRRRLTALEPCLARTTKRSFGTAPLRIAAIDGRFAAGGLPAGAVHELWARHDGHRPAAAGFALALAHHLAAHACPAGRGGDLVWVYPRGRIGEWGLPYAPGLMAFGGDPGRLILVETANTLEALWAGEEALRAAGPAGVIVALDAAYGRHAFMASRRLELAAQAGLASAFLLCAGPDAPVSAASLRWRIAPAPGAASGAGHPSPFPARPRWQVVIERNRLGRTGAFSLEWDHVSRRFLQPVPAVPGAVAAPLVGRAGDAGSLRRLARAGA